MRIAQDQRSTASGRAPWRYVLRVLGVLVGALFIIVGTTLVVPNEPSRLRQLLGLANYLILGGAFVWYGVTGNARFFSLRGRSGPWVLLAAGGLMLTLGLYIALF